MGELDIDAMRRRIGRAQFDRWWVAYHELHLDGSMPAAIVASEVRNSLAPLWYQIGVARKPTTPDDHLPRALVGDDDEPTNPADDDQLDALVDEAERLWG
jgi:hypothetical protein